MKAEKHKSERAAIHEQSQAAWHAAQLNDGAHASHLRSHNVAPVPRVPASDRQKQPQASNDVIATLTSLYAKYKTNVIFVS